MSLELLPRVLFGPNEKPQECSPWPKPVSAFNLTWLKGTFVPDQRDRLARVMDAITKANTEIDKLRDKGTVPEVGQRQANGIVLRSGNDAALERTLRTHAQQQLVRDILALRQPLDLLVVPILKDMARASFTADTLRDRVFSKEACLSRASLTSLDRAGFAALKASYTTWLKDLSPIELFGYAQRCIDDGSAESLPLLDSIRLENFRRKKDDRAFLNAKLLELANVPEFTEAGTLLDEVKSDNQQAMLLWAQFGNHSSRVSVMKIAMGVSNLGVRDPKDPYADME